MAEQRPTRPCVGCGKSDTAPRDVVGLRDGNTAYYHMDCHVLIADCPVCRAILDASGGYGTHLKDDELVAHLNAPKTAGLSEVFTSDNARVWAEENV